MTGDFHKKLLTQNFIPRKIPSRRKAKYFPDVLKLKEFDSRTVLQDMLRSPSDRRKTIPDEEWNEKNEKH